MADYKSQLSVWCQKNGHAFPKYFTYGVSEGNHATQFICKIVLTIDGTEYASTSCEKSTKRAAEQNAANSALTCLQVDFQKRGSLSNPECVTLKLQEKTHIVLVDMDNCANAYPWLEQHAEFQVYLFGGWAFTMPRGVPTHVHTEQAWLPQRELVDHMITWRVAELTRVHSPREVVFYVLSRDHGLMCAVALLHRYKYEEAYFVPDIDQLVVAVNSS